VLAEAERRCRRSRRITPAGDAEEARFVSNFTRDEYMEAVRKVKEYIYAGDIYQANLSQRSRPPCANTPGPSTADCGGSTRRRSPPISTPWTPRSAPPPRSVSWPERGARGNAPHQGHAAALRRPREDRRLPRNSWQRQGPRRALHDRPTSSATTWAGYANTAA